MLPRTRIIRHARRIPPQVWRAGAQWYQVALCWASRIGRAHGYTTDQVAGVIAALSPLMHWTDNLATANEACRLHAGGLSTPPALTLSYTNTCKAWAILDGADPLTVLSGPKVVAFYLAILGAEHAVIDTWAYRAATGKNPPYSPTRRQVEMLTAEYAHAAARLGVSPRTLQAAVWLDIRQ